MVTMISLLYYIPLVFRRDPEPVKIILRLDHSYVTPVTVIAIREKNQDKNKKECSVWVRFYLLYCRNFGHFDTLMQGLAEEYRILYRNILWLDEDFFSETVE